MTFAAWKGDWRLDLEAAVAALGFSSLTEFAEARSNGTYYQLAAELGGIVNREFAPVQIEHSIRDEAIETGTITEFAKKSLVRHLRHLMPEGWRARDESVFNFSHAVGAWTSRLPKSNVKQCEKIAKRIIAAEPERGWVPLDPTDSILARAFADTVFRS